MMLWLFWCFATSGFVSIGLAGLAVMRVINRDLKTVEFQHAATCYGDEIVRWNTDPEHSIAEKQTAPLEVVLMPDVWSVVARQDLPKDAWLVK